MQCARRIANDDRLRGSDGTWAWYELRDYALHHWRERFAARPLPDSFVAAYELEPQDHLAMQAAMQPFIDNAISKTINVPQDYDFAAFRDIYGEAYRLGLKGCTTFRPNPVSGSVLQQPEGDAGQAASGPHCCSIDRESD